MRTSDRGIIAIIGHEGIVPGPYLDTATPPVWTWGVGHTAAAGAPNPAEMPRGMPADLDAAIREAMTVFAADLASYEAEVNLAVTRDITQTQFDALVSFHFNTGAIRRATLTQRINAGDTAGAARAFLNWRTPSSIVGRRTAEMMLFRDGIYPDAAISVWQVSSTGKIIFKAARTLTPAEAITLIRADWGEDAPQVASTEDSGAEETDQDTGLPILARGSKGEHVRLAQTRLVSRGYDLTIDGDFGRRTERAVRRFQAATLLKIDGRIGPITWDHLNLT